MIYISHNLGDVLRLCDDIVVLRDGEVVGAGGGAAVHTDRLVSLMVGRETHPAFPPRDARRDRPRCVLDVRRRQRSPASCATSRFSSARGEVLGISGLMGAGRSELARILFGLDPCAAGEIRLDGEAAAGSPRANASGAAWPFSPRTAAQRACAWRRPSPTTSRSSRCGDSCAPRRAWWTGSKPARAVTRMREAVA